MVTRDFAPEMKTKDKTNKILIVDDDPACAELLMIILKNSRYVVDVHWSVSLQDAQRQAQRTVFDLVLLDVNLPDGKGYDLVPFLKVSQPDSACVLISGNTLEREFMDQHDANLYALLKPLNYTMLNDIFSRHLV